MQSGAVQRFVGLLSHENVDIVIDVVEVVHELTDEDVGDEADEEDEFEDLDIGNLADDLGENVRFPYSCCAYTFS